MRYMIGIDQSTQATKALLFDDLGKLIGRSDILHEQKISSEGFVSHDPMQIYQNTCDVVENLLNNCIIDRDLIHGIGISNQRETTVAWDRLSGRPICDAIVWQCARASKICEQFNEQEKQYVQKTTGIPLSPYFPAAKMAWILIHNQEAQELAAKKQLCFGTIDSWLLFCLTKKTIFKTDYSNASRTQLMNLERLEWDEGLCNIFGISMDMLPNIEDSNACFGWTDFDGILSKTVPIHAVLGDSHGALFGQGCHNYGMVKATYGTGSSIMMNTGNRLIRSSHGIVSSVAWSMDGEVKYVLEGNLNYTGAVITWMKDNLRLLDNSQETETLAFLANPEDSTYFVPAFSGLGAPYWKSDAKALLYGMSRTTGRAEIVKAGLDCIVYQITDILKAMEQDSDMKIPVISVDGGPSRNRYLMQFQSNISDSVVRVPNMEELSGIGAVYMAGITMGIYSKELVCSNIQHDEYVPNLSEVKRKQYYTQWKEAIRKL